MSLFKLTSQPYDLQLAQPFTISRGSKKKVHNVLVNLTDGKYTGWGEAAPNHRYGEDAGDVIAFLDAIPSNFFENITKSSQLTSQIDQYTAEVGSVKSAEAALEMAWLDWWGKNRGQPLWKLWKARSSASPVTSFTIGLAKIGVMQQKVQQAPDYPIYKVKLGTENDRQIIRALREITDKPIRVDANEGWKSLDKAKKMVEFLSRQDIELIEQPMPASRFEDLKKLKEFSPLPLCADESFTGNESIARTAEVFDVINIKLMKTGSLTKAKTTITKARNHNLKVMVGCMIESSVAIAAGALLSLEADYADLDGHLLIADDPADGLSLSPAKQVQLSDAPGLGIHLNR